jgi:hypothetical protein
MVAIYVDLLSPHSISPSILSKFVEELEKTVYAQNCEYVKLQRSYCWEVTFLAI